MVVLPLNSQSRLMIHKILILKYYWPQHVVWRQKGELNLQVTISIISMDVHYYIFSSWCCFPNKGNGVKGSFSGTVHRWWPSDFWIPWKWIWFVMSLLNLPQTLDILQNTRNSAYRFDSLITSAVTITHQYLVLQLLSKINCIITDTKLNFSSSWAED